MRMRTRRASSCLLLAIAAGGLLGLAQVSLAASHACCAPAAEGEWNAPPRACQWVTTSVCCDSPLVTSAAGAGLDLGPTVDASPACVSPSGPAASVVFALPRVIEKLHRAPLVLRL